MFIKKIIIKQVSRKIGIVGFFNGFDNRRKISGTDPDENGAIATIGWQKLGWLNPIMQRLLVVILYHPDHIPFTPRSQDRIANGSFGGNKSEQFNCAFIKKEIMQLAEIGIEISITKIPSCNDMDPEQLQKTNADTCMTKGIMDGCVLAWPAYIEAPAHLVPWH